MAVLAQLTDDVVVHTFEITPPQMTIGRNPNCDIQITESSVSAIHAIITQMPNRHFPQFMETYLQDQDSTNGTFVNEQPVIGRQRLHNNDVIRFAWHRFKFFDNLEAELEKTTHILQD